MIVNSYEIGKKQINTPHDLGEQYPVMKALMI
jgi:hypothetical protein